MEKIFQILTDLNSEEDVRDLWSEVFHYTNENKYCAHNLVVGIPQKGDTLLWQQMVNKEPNTMGWVKHTISYPPENNTLPEAVITGIAVIDVKNDKTGGVAEIKSGGIGSDSVVIKLRGDFWRGFAFQVIIIGKYAKDDYKQDNNDNETKEEKNQKFSFNINYK